MVEVRQHIIPRCIADVSGEVVNQVHRFCSILHSEIAIEYVVGIYWTDHHGKIIVVTYVINVTTLFKNGWRYR